MSIRMAPSPKRVTEASSLVNGSEKGDSLIHVVLSQGSQDRQIIGS